MAGGRIKGITVEIGGDTTGLQNALKQVNSSIKTTQSALKDVNKLLKLDPTNTELLSQKDVYKRQGRSHRSVSSYPCPLSCGRASEDTER